MAVSTAVLAAETDKQTPTKDDANKAAPEAKDAAVRHVRAALLSIDRIVDVLKEGEHDAFKGWHSDHQCFKAIRQRNLTEAAITGLLKGPQPKAPNPSPPGE